MSEHFSSNTVSASFWCSKCSKFTQHRIDDKRKGPCLACIERLNEQTATPKAPAPKQGRLFV